jgi:hypothetical protein
MNSRLNLDMVDIKEKLEKGYIHARVIIGIVGKPKEFIEQTLKDYIANIKKHEDYILLNSDFSEARELEEDKTLFSTFSEVELLAKNINALTGFCFDYMPSSIEILAPEKLNISAPYFSQVMNDLQGKLHKLDMALKQASNENEYINKNVNLLLRNMVTLIIGKNKRTLEEISALSGLQEKDINIFLENLIKKGVLEKEGNFYKLKNVE